MPSPAAMIEDVLTLDIFTLSQLQQRYHLSHASALALAQVLQAGEWIEPIICYSTRRRFDLKEEEKSLSLHEASDVCCRMSGDNASSPLFYC